LNGEGTGYRGQPANNSQSLLAVPCPLSPVPWFFRPRSSADESAGLRIRRPQVRILAGACRRYRDVAQWEERSRREREVRGSSPRVSTGRWRVGGAAAAHPPFLRDVAQPGSALGWGPRGRRFEPGRPDFTWRVGGAADRTRLENGSPARAEGSNPSPSSSFLAPVAQERTERRKTFRDGSQTAGCGSTEPGGAPSREARFPGLSDSREGVRGFESRRGHLIEHDWGGWQSGRMRPFRKREPRCGPGVRIPHLPLTTITRARSSAEESVGFRDRRPQVRALPGALEASDRSMANEGTDERASCKPVSERVYA
jgi:hypothetical protein